MNAASQPLTAKQKLICDLVAEGFSSKEIARELGIGSRTVEDHRRVIYGKLGVRNAVQLTRKILGVENADRG